MTEMNLPGNVQVGFVRGRGPKFRLVVSPQRLSLWCFRPYEFTPEQVVAIEPAGPKWLGAGIRIRHNRTDCPGRISFRCSAGQDAILRAVSEAGFVPCGQASSSWRPYLGPGRLLFIAMAIYAAFLLTRH